MINLDFLNDNYEDTRTYQEKVTDLLIEDIMDGVFKPGSRLIEQKLCDKYHMSRTPVREILKQLSSTGLVEMIPNRGCFVIGITDQDIDDFYQLRYLLFPQAVKWAIERVNDEELDALKEVYSFIDFYSQAEDIDKLVRIIAGYNRVIYVASKSPELRKILERGEKLINFSNKRIFLIDGYAKETLDTYQVIHEAFLRRNPVSGYDAAQIHIYNTIRRRTR